MRARGARGARARRTAGTTRATGTTGTARSIGSAGSAGSAGRARTAGAAATAVAAAALLLAGCGSADGVRVGRPDPGPSTSQPDCGDVLVTPVPGSKARGVCLSIGSTLRVQLATGDAPPAERGGALTEVSPGVYRGTRAGTAELSGFRRACPSPRPGAVACHAIAGWKVTVDVR